MVAATLAADADTTVHIDVKDKSGIEFRHGKELSGRYHIGPEVAKPYMWPLNAPNGKAVTRAWPMEPKSRSRRETRSSASEIALVLPRRRHSRRHRDQEEEQEGVKGVDFWDEAANHGRIVCVKVGEPVAEEESRQDHDAERMAFRRTTSRCWTRRGRFTLIDFGEAQLLRLRHRPARQRCARSRSATRRKARSACAWRETINEERGKGKLTNADGKHGEGEEQRRARGLLGSEVGLVRLFGAGGRQDGRRGDLRRSEEPVPTCWHSRGYGLMAANPFGRDKAGFPATKGNKDLVKLAKGEHLKLRYGVLLHDGDVKDGKVAEYYKKFVDWKE